MRRIVVLMCLLAGCAGGADPLKGLAAQAAPALVQVAEKHLLNVDPQQSVCTLVPELPDAPPLPGGGKLVLCYVRGLD